jgi:uncharacterized membrane protein YjfL (UPF0719 family)
MDSHIIFILAVNIVISVGLITSLRFIKGITYGVSTKEELSVRDNFAFGISFGGEVIGLSLVMMGVMSGKAASSLGMEILSIFEFALLGLILIKAGGYFQDKIVLSKLPIQDEISKENTAAALIDMSHLIATGLIIRAAMLWVDGGGYNALIMVIFAFIAAQLIMLLVSLYRRTAYKRRNNGAELESAIKDQNIALSLRYSGHIIGAALTVASVSQIVVFNPMSFNMSVIIWLISGIAGVLVMSLLAFIARLVILKGINVVEEVDQQENVGVAAIEAAIYIAIGLVFMGGLN